MKRKASLLSSILVLSSFFMFYVPSFAEYAFLCGKRAELHGPIFYTHIGVSLDEKTCDEVTSILHTGSHKKFDKLLFKNYDIMRVENNTKVLVLTTDIFAGKAKVVIFTGYYKGMSGWVPIEWLDNNEERPRLSSVK